MPWRALASSLIAVSPSRIASAARTARSGSSSCACGMPKTAITASPLNFSTVPPRASISRVASSKNSPDESADDLRIEPLAQ